MTGTGLLKEKLNIKSILSIDSGAKADIYVKNGDLIKFGSLSLECRSTPGHTNGCMTYVIHETKMAFTGDALLIGGCGRTDFQQGDPATLYDVVHEKILSLSDDYLLYTAHDYSGNIFRFNLKSTRLKRLIVLVNLRTNGYIGWRRKKV